MTSSIGDLLRDVEDALCVEDLETKVQACFAANDEGYVKQTTRLGAIKEQIQAREQSIQNHLNRLLKA